MIIRKYNYKLETGPVGTDDDNIANILYNINRMEMKVSYASTDMDALDKELGSLFFLITDAKVHLNRFLKISGAKVSAETAREVIMALDGAMQIVDDALLEESDCLKKSPAFPAVYGKLLGIVPSVLALDAKAAGRA